MATLLASVALGAWITHLVADGVAFRVGKSEFELLAPRGLVALAVLPFLVWVASRSLADLPGPQRVLGVAVRSLLIACLAIALARLARTTDATRVSTVYLVDVSESLTDEALAEAQARIEAAWAARGEDDDLQIVTFARDARRLQRDTDADEDRAPVLRRHDEAGAGPPNARDAPTGEASPEDASEPAGQAGRGSNLEAALQLAYGLFPAGHLRRAVLLTDGLQTAGDVLAEASRAAGFGVRVHVVPSRLGAPPEVALRGLELPERIQVGEPFPVRARVFASRPGNARLRLYQGETLNGLGGVQDVELPAGESEVELRSIVRVAGPVTYRATLTPAAGVPDRFAANNEVETTVVVPGKPRVLYVEGARGRGTYLTRALGAADYDVDVRGPRALPTSLRELERFDFVILSDVSADQVSLGQQGLLERYVRDVGGGFMMAGVRPASAWVAGRGARSNGSCPCAWMPSDGATNRPSPSPSSSIAPGR